MPDELPPAPPPGGQPPRRRLPSAKDTLMRMNQSKEVQRQADREARRKETEKRRKQQLREIMRLARTDIEKIVAKDASEKDYDDAWTYLQEVAEHGCSSGIVSDLIYTSSCVKFYQKHKEEIWEQLSQDAESAGEPVLNYIASMRWASDVDHPDTFENNLAWFGYEAACQRLLDRKEFPEDEGPEPNLDIDV